LKGGAGRDGVGASLNLDSTSAGTVSATVNGNSDDDLLTLLLTTGDAFTGTVTGTAKGGAGINRAVGPTQDARRVGFTRGYNAAA